MRLSIIMSSKWRKKWSVSYENQEDMQSQPFPKSFKVWSVIAQKKIIKSTWNQRALINFHWFYPHTKNCNCKSIYKLIRATSIFDNKNKQSVKRTNNIYAHLKLPFIVYQVFCSCEVCFYWPLSKKVLSKLS